MERVSVPYDARLKKIVLTNKAVEIHKTVIKDIEKREQRLRNDLTNAEIDNFLTTLDKLTKNMEEQND